jgi:hypothetical protein
MQLPGIPQCGTTCLWSDLTLSLSPRKRSFVKSPMSQTSFHPSQVRPGSGKQPKIRAGERRHTYLLFSLPSVSLRRSILLPSSCRNPSLCTAHPTQLSSQTASLIFRFCTKTQLYSQVCTSLDTPFVHYGGNPDRVRRQRYV